VRLATTRTPSGEDEAVLQPGQTVVLHSSDVAYGETIDGRLEYAAMDGSGVTFVDELEEYSFTRPSKEDCDAIAAPSSTEPSGTTTASGSADSSAPTTGGATTEAPATDSGTPTQGAIVPTVGGGTPAPQQVTAGDTVTLQAGGFLPGELVTVQLQGSDRVLATATAGPDGTVRADVRIPDSTDAGATTVHLTGTQTETVTDVALQVAAARTPLATTGAGDVVPLVAAALALVAATGALVSVAGRQRGNRVTIRRA